MRRFEFLTMCETKNPFISAITAVTSSSVEPIISTLNRQSFTYWELIIICLEEEREAISSVINAFDEETVRKIKVVSFDANNNYAKAINIGIRSASGEYLIIVDQNDGIDYCFFEELYHSFRHQGVKLYYPEVKIHYSTRFLNRPLLLGSRKHPSNDELFLAKKMIVSHTCASLCFVFPKSIIKEIGYFDENVTEFSIWEYFIKLSLAMDFYKLSGISYLFNIDKESGHPRLPIMDLNKVDNYRYHLINYYSKKQSRLPTYEYDLSVLDVEKITQQDRAKAKVINKTSYNLFFKTLIIKSFKLVLLIVNKIKVKFG